MEIATKTNRLKGVTRNKLFNFISKNSKRGQANCSDEMLACEFMKLHPETFVKTGNVQSIRKELGLKAKWPSRSNGHENGNGELKMEVTRTPEVSTIVEIRDLLARLVTKFNA